MTPRDFVIEFADQFITRVGDEYIIAWGRDCKIMKDLLESISEDDLSKCIKLYFDKKRDFYDPRSFKNEVGLLKQKLPKKHKELINPESDRYNDIGEKSYCK